MKKILILMGVLFLLFCSSVLAGIAYNPNTGNLGLDSSLKILDETASKNVADFVNALNGAYNVDKNKADNLINNKKMSPADVYMAAKIAKLSGKPLDNVVTTYEKNKGKGWGVIAKKMGIKPGSKEFHALKADDSGILAKAKEKHLKEKKAKDKKQNSNKNTGKNK
jgi:hypothetical protein